MAKGVVICPVVNSSVTITKDVILNYGILSYDNVNYCLGYQYNNPTEIPVLYAGKVNNNGCLIGYGNGMSYLRMYYVSSNTNPNSVSLTTSGSVPGLAYYHYTATLGTYGAVFPASIAEYDTFSSVVEMATFISNMTNVSITYNSGAVVAAGPKLVSEGSQVRVILSIPRGVTVTNSDISITKNGVTVPFTYSNGALTFTA